MAELTPLYVTVSNVYNGPSLGLPNRDIFSEGIVLAGDMAVSAGTGNSVNIAQGSAWIVGDTDTFRQPTYRIQNDAVVNLGINPDPTNPRIVRVGAQLNDADFVGATRNFQLQALHGTPAGSPVAPAEPTSFLTLATILVPNAAASSAVYTFTDARVRAKVGGGPAQSGSGGTGAPATVASTDMAGGAGGLASASTGQIKFDGQDGQPSTIAGGSRAGGDGGMGGGRGGAGGRRPLNNASGLAGRAPGGGGSGSLDATVAARPGGAGGAGTIIVWEFA